MDGLIDPFELLLNVVKFAGMFTAFRIILTIIYPLFSGCLWQSFGPIVTQFIPSLGQNEDVSRPSYIPSSNDEIAIKIAIPDQDASLIGGITRAFLYSSALGFYLLLAGSAVILIPCAIVLVGRYLWRLSNAKGPAITDLMFSTLYELILYILGPFFILGLVHTPPLTG